MKIMKSIGATILSLCMLCALLLSVTVLPAVAAETGAELPMAFEADFADLAEVVDPADFVDGVYTPMADDLAANQWANTRFDFVHTREGADYPPRVYLGQDSQAFDYDNMNWGGIHRWVVAQDGYLQHTVTKQGGEMLRKGEQMVLKTADGAQAQLENFEATIVFNTMQNGCGAVGLSFHEKVAGRLINNVKADRTTSNAVIIGNGAGYNGATGTDGIMIRKHGSAHSKTNIVDTATGLVASEQFAQAFAANADYVLYVKVLNGTVTVKVNSLDGATVFYNKTFANAVDSYNGTISVGATNANRAFKSIVVRELDANGAYVPFGTATTNVSTFAEDFNALWPYSGGKYVGSTTNDTDQGYFVTTWGTANADAVTEIAQVLNLKFNEHMDFYGTYTTPNFTNVVTSNSYGESAGFWELLSNNTLQRPATIRWNRNMRFISSLVPKSERTGEELKMTNMEASFGIYWNTATTITSKEEMDNSTAPGTVIFGFRQQQSGAFTVADGKLRQDTAFVVISQTGFTVMGGSECAGSHDGLFNTEADEYSFFDYNTGYQTQSNAVFTVKVRAVGDDVKLQIAKSGTDIFNNFADGAQAEVVIDAGGFVEEGTVAFAVGENKAGLRALRLTRLDDDGNPINLDVYPETFDVDFSELAGVVSEDGTYDASGLYDPDYDDEHINTWVNDRFNIYLGKEAQSTTPQLMYLGQSSYNFAADAGEKTSWGGEHKWLINENGYLQYDAETVPYETVRKGQQLAVKTADGALAQMENFEATMVFNTLGNDKGGVAISFHEKAASRVADGGTAARSNSNVVYILNDNARDGFTTSADAAVVRASGKTVKKPLSTTVTEQGNGILLNEMFGDGKNLAKNTDYKLTVRVVNKQVDIKVFDMKGTVMYEGSVTVESSYNGTVSFGVFDSDRAIKSIAVRELDENGKVVDFGTHTTNKKTFTFNADGLLKRNDGTAPGSKYVGSAVVGVDGVTDSNTVSVLSDNITEATKTELRYLLRSKFKEYHDAVGNYLETDFELLSAAGTAYGNNGGRDNAGFWQVWNGQWLQRIQNNIQYKENMRIISSLVPLDEHTGEEIQASDFEATYTVRFENATVASAVFGFRQALPGKFTRSSYWLVQDQAFITVTPTGIAFGAGPDQIPATQNKGTDKFYNTDGFYSFADGGYTAASYPVFTITVKAEGDSAYLKIVDESGEVVFNNFEGGANEALAMDISSAPEKGYIAFGIGEYQASIASVALSVLDGQADEDVDMTGTVFVRNDVVGDNKQTLIVEAADGFELKAGSLTAIDADGNVYIPTRVGFRSDVTEVNCYEIPTDKDVDLTYEFIQPTLENPNIGNVGTSINQEAGGLRFVSRFNRVMKDDKEYLTLDGAEYEIVDYGMLIAFASVVEGNNGVLDIALSEKYSYVQKFSIYNTAKVYYDFCNTYVDMSVCVIKLDAITNGKNIDLTARAWVTVLVNGEETTLYANAFTSNYNENV